jgi:hypothetical protein
MSGMKIDDQLLIKLKSVMRGADLARITGRSMYGRSASSRRFSDGAREWMPTLTYGNRYKMRYVGMFSRIPRQLKNGRVLVHNHIWHTKDMPIGVNGFRAWTQARAPNLIVCKCGWAGVPHYRVRGLGTGHALPGSWKAPED